MPPPEPPEPPPWVDVGKGSPGKDGRLGKLGTPGRLGSDGSEGNGSGSDGAGLEVADGFGAGAELWVGSGSEGSGSDGSDGAGLEVLEGAVLWVGSGSDGKGSEGKGSGSDAPDEEVGNGGNKPAKAGAPVSIRARVPAATVPARRAALLGIVGVPSSSIASRSPTSLCPESDGKYPPNLWAATFVR
jgi:hypothetical protein